LIFVIALIYRLTRYNVRGLV